MDLEVVLVAQDETQCSVAPSLGKQARLVESDEERDGTGPARRSLLIGGTEVAPHGKNEKVLQKRERDDFPFGARLGFGQQQVDAIAGYEQADAEPGAGAAT